MSEGYEDLLLPEWTPEALEAARQQCLAAYASGRFPPQVFNGQIGSLGGRMKLADRLVQANEESKALGRMMHTARGQAVEARDAAREIWKALLETDFERAHRFLTAYPWLRLLYWDERIGEEDEDE